MPARFRSRPHNLHESLCRIGDELREKHLVRHIHILFHNGRQWTIESRWERFDDNSNEWIEILWTDLGQPHSTLT